MKKHYIRITMIIEVLILVMFILGGVFFTYVTANAEMKEHMKYAKNDITFSLPAQTTDSEETLIKDVTMWHWGMIVDIPRRDMGYYGRLDLSDDYSFDTSKTYCVVSNSEDSFLSDEDLRICTLNPELFDFDRIYDPEIDSECDNIFIYGGKLNDNGKICELGDISYRESERIPVSEWANGQYLYCTIVNFAENKQKEKLNIEAQEIGEGLIEEFLNGKWPGTEKENLLTSYYFNYHGTYAGILYDIYVFHPIQLAVKKHVTTYVILFIALMAIEVIIAFVFAKLYKNRNEYEMRSNRLKRGIAHELKTPLAVTKAYMENWEYIDEEDRPEYAEKINREVGDMTDLINTLLEMDKIDSGKVKLNKEEVELASLIKSVYGRVKPLADERGLEVTFKMDKEYVINADLKLIKIAIGNYLTNMVKYADKTAEAEILVNGNRYRVEFRNDSTNDSKSRIDKINSNGMGVEINENIMKLHGFKSGSVMLGKETMFWFEADMV